MEEKLLDIQISIDLLTESVDSISDHLKVISREMVISNLPTDIRKHQRQYFNLEDELRLQIRMKRFYQERLDESKDGVGSEGFQFDVEKKEQRIKNIQKEMSQLLNKGCVIT